MIHDEIATFFRFVQVQKFLPYHSEWSTNNHILNSFLTWISYSFLGSAPIIQRLPNLLFIPVYFWFLYRISEDLKSRLLRIALLVVLVSIHNYIDFFSFSRGYGMGIALLTGAIYYTKRYLQQATSQNLAAALLLMLFSTSAILIYVNAYIVIIGLIVLKMIRTNWQNQTKLTIQSITVLFAGILPICGTILYLIDMQQFNRLDYGGSSGFWEDSVGNLTNLLAGPLAPVLNIYILVALGSMVLFFGILLKSGVWKEIAFDFPNPGDVFLYLLIGNVVAFHLEHILFGVLYPADRTSLQFVLFFTGSLFFILDRLPYRFRLARIVLVAPLVWFPVHFFLSLNTNKTAFEFSNHNIPPHFFDQIKNHPSSDGYPATIQGHQLRVMRWNWLNYTQKGELAPVQYTDYPSTTADYQIVDTLAHPDWRTSYRLIETTAESTLALAERKQKYRRIPVYHAVNNETRATAEEYVLLGSIDVDSLAGQAVFIGFRLTLVSDATPLHAWVSAEVRDLDEKPRSYEYLQLDWYRPSWRAGDPEFVNGLLFNQLPEDASRLLIYIWNEYKIPLSVEQSQLDLFVLKKPEILNTPERY
jgi:type IV secretory pathway VirB2 component (pilin)